MPEPYVFSFQNDPETLQILSKLDRFKRLTISQVNHLNFPENPGPKQFKYLTIQNSRIESVSNLNFLSTVTDLDFSSVEQFHRIEGNI
jgi:hypothetical protein